MEKEIFSKEILEQCVENDVVEAMAKLVNYNNLLEVTQGAAVIADYYGASDIYDSVVINNSVDAEQNLITSFHNNLGLLIQKTWVEEADEVLKDQILYKLEQVCNLLKEKQYSTVYKNYIDLINDVVYLMFGSLSIKEDFYEYSLRIDPGFGVFWCCLKSIVQTNPADDLVARLYILLGMMFLSNY